MAGSESKVQHSLHDMQVSGHTLIALVWARSVRPSPAVMANAGSASAWTMVTAALGLRASTCKQAQCLAMDLPQVLVERDMLTDTLFCCDAMLEQTYACAATRYCNQVQQ